MFLSDFGQELFYSRLKLCHPTNIYSFCVKIIREWNDLPANVVEIGNLRRFKIALQSYMRIS